MLKCPRCQTLAPIVKKGFFRRPSDQKKIQRYRCLSCRRSFSDQCFRIDYRHRKRHINQPVFRLLCQGMSQENCAVTLGVKAEAIARRVVRFGLVARAHLSAYRASRHPLEKVMFDEMESFEHTKCKPLTIPIVVEEKTRKIISLRVGQIAAKGHLAAISRKKYGPRRCERGRCLNAVLTELKLCSDPRAAIKSDESQHYPARVKQFFPEAAHRRYKGRRSAVVGQGELKRGGFDPLFSLNHTYAMIRDNLKRLTRRTWCTTKRRDRLEDLIYLYAYYHNQRLETKKVILHSSYIPI